MPKNDDQIFVPRRYNTNKGVPLRRRDVDEHIPVHLKGLDDGDLDDPFDFRESDLFLKIERILMAFLRSRWAMGDGPTVGTIARSFLFHPYLNDALESLAAGRSIEYVQRGSRCHVIEGHGFPKREPKPYSTTLQFGARPGGLTQPPRFWYNDGTAYGRYGNSTRKCTATA